MYKTSLRNLCSLNCCYKYTMLSKVFVITRHYLNTNAQTWSLKCLRFLRRKRKPKKSSGKMGFRLWQHFFPILEKTNKKHSVWCLDLFINATVFPFLNDNTIQLHSLGTHRPDIHNEWRILRPADTLCKRKKKNRLDKPSVDKCVVIDRRLFFFNSAFWLTPLGLMQEHVLNQ